MPHTDAIFRIRPDPKPRSELAAKFRDNYRGQTFLYAITDGIAIKFGSAWDVEARLKGLQTAHHAELKCLGTILAKKGTEPLVHKALFQDRIAREWFSLSERTEKMVSLFSAGDVEALYEHIAGCLEKRIEFFMARCT